MPDQIVPTPVTATTPPVNTANDQSLDDILNDLEKQYNITPPSQEKTAIVPPAAPVVPIKPMEASVPTPPPVKPLTEPPKFEVKEHAISTEPKLEKVKPMMPPVMEKTEMVKPVSPVQDKGAGFEALEQTKNAMPNEFDAPPAVKPVEPPKTENVPPTAPPPKKGGASNVAKILGGVVGVLMLVAGTFAVNKLVTQPQDIRQQASGCAVCDVPGDSQEFCEGGGVKTHTCNVTDQGYCWGASSQVDPFPCPSGQVCRQDGGSAECVDPNPGGTCNANVSGGGTVLDFSASDCIGQQWSATLYVCTSRACGNDPDYGVCHTACDPTAQAFTYGPGTIDVDNWTNRLDAKGRTNLDCKLMQFDGAINTPGGQATGHTIWDDLRPDCGVVNNITCDEKVVTLANLCQDHTQDCSRGTPVGSTVAPGTELVFDISTKPATGSPTNVKIVDVLPPGIEWVGSPSTACSYNSTNRTVTCNKGNLQNGDTTGVLIKVRVSDSIAPGTHTNTATVTADSVAATTCSASINVVASSASCTAKKAYLATGCTTTDCPSKTPLAANAYVAKGSLIIYETIVTTSSGVAQNPVITDELDPNFSYVAGDAGCSRVSNTVTCTKGSPLASGQTWSPKILVELTGRMGTGTTPPLPENINNVATFTSTGAGTNTCAINLKPSSSLVCTSLSLNPESPTPNESTTATCATVPNAGYYRFRKTDNSGFFTENAPTTSNTFSFTANSSGTTIVQCSVCRTADTSTCSVYEDVANLTGGAPGVCTKVIAPPPPILACVNISYTPAIPKLGDNVTITCGDVSSLGATRYEFGYTTAVLNDSNPRDVWIDVAPASEGSRISSPFTVTTSGTYTMRCRPCNGVACTNWDIN